MRFVCDSCRAQYMISDDKVGPRGVKVRCKKCGHTITVRPAEGVASKAQEAPASPSCRKESGASRRVRIPQLRKSRAQPRCRESMCSLAIAAKTRNGWIESRCISSRWCVTGL
ncbi:zinc-ribbon domain-containing protein [Pyxidicoccus parkwayensis]|uniref:Zinc-ribbon domain-containing protein n=1 Tax=Pyxidicoccus parkwayensis TaxID=2813578 RepID=A0ABX7NTK3_9BACT|nr:zinc-ribbon domain-containing protein [Pyxidicoccus parkwaysis]